MTSPPARTAASLRVRRHGLSLRDPLLADPAGWAIGLAPAFLMVLPIPLSMLVDVGTSVSLAAVVSLVPTLALLNVRYRQDKRHQMRARAFVANLMRDAGDTRVCATGDESELAEIYRLQCDSDRRVFAATVDLRGFRQFYAALAVLGVLFATIGAGFLHRYPMSDRVGLLLLLVYAPVWRAWFFFQRVRFDGGNLEYETGFLLWTFTRRVISLESPTQVECRLDEGRVTLTRSDAHPLTINLCQFWCPLELVGTLIRRSLSGA